MSAMMDFLTMANWPDWAVALRNLAIIGAVLWAFFGRAR